MSFDKLEDLAAKIGDPTTADEDLFDHVRDAAEILTGQNHAEVASDIITKISSCQAGFVRTHVADKIRATLVAESV